MRDEDILVFPDGTWLYAFNLPFKDPTPSGEPVRVAFGSKRWYEIATS